MKAFLAVLLSMFIITGDVSSSAYSMPVQSSNTSYAQDVHFLQEETAADDTGKETDTESEGRTKTDPNPDVNADAATNSEADTNTGGPQISAPSAILMEASTGSIIYEKDADTARPPASVTKVMTMLLIFDALESGKIRLEDEVTTSEYAASMGGSQVFLEPGETQTVETMLKCISVASANDACVSFHKGRQQADIRLILSLETNFTRKYKGCISISALTIQ